MYVQVRGVDNSNGVKTEGVVCLGEKVSIYEGSGVGREKEGEEEEEEEEEGLPSVFFLTHSFHPRLQAYP